MSALNPRRTNYKNLFLTVLLFFAVVIVTILLFIVAPKASQPDSLYAIEGSANITSTMLETTDIFSLAGEWEFYPNEFIDYGHFNTKPYYVMVPGHWGHYDLGDIEMPKKGFGTYRLKLQLPEGSSIYGLRYTRIRSAGKLFINGELKAQSGIPSTLESSHQSFIKPQTTYFTNDSNEIEIIIHASNYGFDFNGGLSHGLFFGTHSGISSYVNKLSNQEWMLMSAYLFSVIYFLGSFIVVRIVNKKFNFSLLAFTSYIIFMTLYKLTHGERLILEYFPTINYRFFYILQQLPIAISIISLSIYGYLLYPHKLTKKLNYILVFLGLTSVFRVIGLSTETFSGSLWYESFLMTLTYFYLCGIFTYSVIRKKPGSSLLLIGVIAICLDVYIEGTVAFTTQSVNIIYPVQPFIFLLSQILLNSTNFSHQIDQSEKLADKILQNDRLKDEFLAKTTHEFKTPLNGIVNILHSLTGSESTLTTHQKEDVELVQGIALRLSTLVNDILDVTKIDYDELSLNTSVVDVKSIASLVVHVCDLMHHEDKIKIINNIPSSLPPVTADEQRLKQIFYNLIGNALKFTVSGTVTLEATSNDTHVSLTVVDTGIGISPNNLNNIFNAYYQSPDDNHKAQGHGLGLSITKKLVTLHGGTISATSQVNKGTAVTFTLPMAPVIAPSLLEPSPTSTPLISSFVTPAISNVGGRYKLLVVDDEFIGLKAISNALLDYDYELILVKSGREALDYIEANHRVDIVILDLMMPEMSGFDVCTAIRKHYSLTELPILMLTAAIQPNDILSAYDAGANDFLNKPFNQIQLVTRLNSLITVAHSTKYAIEMESALLLSQIRPHFMYNVLTAIAAISYNDQDAGRSLLLKFSSYLRMSFDMTQFDQLISIEKELEYIQIYVDIQNVRFEDTICYHLDHRTNKPYFILPLLIEPIVENAIKHAKPEDNSPLNISLTITELEDQLRISIKDDGCGMTDDQISKVLSGHQGGLGLYNVKKRLSRYYNSQLHIHSSLNEGTHIWFDIH